MATIALIETPTNTWKTNHDAIIRRARKLGILPMAKYFLALVGNGWAQVANGNSLEARGDEREVAKNLDIRLTVRAGWCGPSKVVTITRCIVTADAVKTEIVARWIDGERQESPA